MDIYFFFLVFLRVSGIFVLSPVFGRRNIPNMLKVALCMSISYIFVGVFQPVVGSTPHAVPEYALLCVKELLIGLSMGYMAIIFFNVANTAGQIIDVHIGFGLAQLYDPENFQSVPVMSSLLNLALLLYFFGANGHLMLLKILYVTFERIPPGSMIFRPEAAIVIGEAFALAFAMAVSIALPVIAAEFIVEAAFGIIIRAVPQMNIFIAGIPVKIFVGLVVMALTAVFYSGYAITVFDRMYAGIDKVLGRMVPQL